MDCPLLSALTQRTDSLIQHAQTDPNKLLVEGEVIQFINRWDQFEVILCQYLAQALGLCVKLGATLAQLKRVYEDFRVAANRNFDYIINNFLLKWKIDSKTLNKIRADYVDRIRLAHDLFIAIEDVFDRVP